MPNQIIVFIPDISQGNTVLFGIHICSGYAIDLLRYEAVFLCLFGETGGDDHGTDRSE
jgi:hypothetical protein